jgi:aspartyl protease family protein
VTNSLQLGGVYILMAVMLVMGMLLSRRERPIRLIATAVGWTAVFAAGFVLFTFRDDPGLINQRLRAEATGRPVEQGSELRIPMAIDGHFWVNGEVNGQPVEFLIDSGATMTTVGRVTAEQVGLTINQNAAQIVRTGNGLIRVSTGRAGTLTVGEISRPDMAMHVADNEDLNVLGMNFLSSLRRWGVEGRWLILEY